MAVNTSLGVTGLDTTALQAGEDRLIHANHPSRMRAGDDAKIEKGAREFEAVLVGSWLQQAEQSFATLPGADQDQDAGRDQMMSLGVQSLATSMAATGGIGLAAMISKSMHHMADKQDSQAGSGKNATEGKN
jgi:Rod binding domain-containing protein